MWGKLESRILILLLVSMSAFIACGDDEDSSSGGKKSKTEDRDRQAPSSDAGGESDVKSNPSSSTNASDSDSDSDSNSDSDSDSEPLVIDLEFELNAIELPVPLDVSFTATISNGVSQESLQQLVSLSGGQSVTVTLDEETGRVTIEPTSLLRAATDYTLTISAELADSMGASLGEEVKLDFRTVSDPATVLNGAGLATHQNTKLAQDENGNAVALWTVRFDVGGRSREDWSLVYSTFTAATETWSSETVLIERTTSSIDFDILSSGSNFQLAYRQGSNPTKSRLLTYINDWTLEAELQVDTTSRDFKLVTDGSGYAVVQSSSRDLLFIDQENDGWATPVDLAPDTTVEEFVAISGDGQYVIAWAEGESVVDSSDVKAVVCVTESGCGSATTLDDRDEDARHLTGAFQNDTYMIAWDQEDTTYSDRRVLVVTYSSSTWSTPELVEVGPDDDEITEEPRLAAGGPGFAMAFKSSKDIYTSVFDSAEATWNTETLIYERQSGSSREGEFGIVGNNLNFVVWNQEGKRSEDPYPPLSTYFYDADAETWGSAISIPQSTGSWRELAIAGQSQTLDPSESRFVALGTHLNSDGTGEIFFCESTGTSWNTPQSLESAVGGIGGVALHATTNSFIGAYSVDGRLVGLDAELVQHELVSGSYRTAPASQILTRNGEQNVLVVWEQGMGNVRGLLSSYFDGSQWSIPMLVTTAHEMSEDYETQMTAGNAFFIARYRKYDRASDSTAFFVRVFEEGQWQEEIEISERFLPKVAASPNQGLVVVREEYVVAEEDDDEGEGGDRRDEDSQRFIYKMYESGAWSDSGTIVDGLTGFNVPEPHIAARGDQFCLFGPHETDGYTFNYSGGSWTAQTNPDYTDLESEDVLATLANENDCHLIFEASDESLGTDNVFVISGFGDSWTRTGLGSSPDENRLDDFALTSDGLVVSYSDSDNYTASARIFDGSTWLAESTFSADYDELYSSSVAWNGEEFLFVTSYVTSEDTEQVSARIFDGTEWGPDQLLADYAASESSLSYPSAAGASERFIVTLQEGLTDSKVLRLYEWETRALGQLVRYSRTHLRVRRCIS